MPRTPSRLEAASLVEYSRRRNMAVSMFRPMPHQDPFFRDYARQFLLRGGNRSGKSVCAAAKFAATAMDMPITLSDGTQVHQRQPWQRGRCIRMWVIGYDAQHIGQTIYRLLFRKGSDENKTFKLLRDEETGLYRSFRMWDEKDRARQSEVKPAPPFIPARYVDQGSWVWENKKAKEFKSVIIRDPQTKEPLAEIYAFSSRAEPKAGDPVDAIWIDEKIETATHYAEWKARLVDNRGHLFWSSWPAVSNDALRAISNEADEQKDWDTPLVRETVITMSDNKALPQDIREETLAMYSEDERRARDRGEYITDQLRMYPIFDEFIHAAVSEHRGDPLSNLLKMTGGIPPISWTHELILDPGTQHPAVLMCAIPPPEEFGECYVVYKEIYPGRADAMQLGKIVSREHGGRQLYRMIIDARAGRQQQMGYSHRVMDNYIEAWKKFRISCTMSGNGFSRGCSDVGARIGKLQEWMHLGEKGFPKLRIVRDSCPELCKQLTQYMKSSVNNEVIDDRPAKGQKIDLAVCLEYWAASFPAFVKPSDVQVDDPNVVWYEKTFGRRGRSSGPSYEIGSRYSV